MDFTLSEDQNDIRELADRVISRRSDTYEAAAPSDATWFDRLLWGDLANAGLLGIAVDEAIGGSGAGFLEQCLVIEAAAKHAARIPLIETVVQAALPVAHFGTDDVKTRVLEPFCSGAAIITSSSAQDEALTSHLTAAHDGESWLLDGYVDHVPIADRATTALVSASTADGQRAWFIIGLSGGGVTLEPQSSVDRVQRWRLNLDHYPVEATDVLAAPGPDSVQVSDWLQAHTGAARCIAQASAADAALRMTAAHVTQREQFGTPVGSFQAVAHRVADAYIDVTAMSLTAWRAAWLLAEDLPSDEELAIASWWAADAGSRVAEATMHLHGGQSVDLDYPLHRYFLALRYGELALGGPGRRLLALGDILAVAS